MIDPATLAIIASITGMSVKELAKLYRKQAASRKEKTRLLRLAGRMEGTQRVISFGLHQSALDSLYTKEKLLEQSLIRFEVAVDKTRVATEIVGEPDLLEMNLGISDDTERHTLIDDPLDFPMPSAEAAARVAADVAERKLEIWDQPIYSLLSFKVEDQKLVAEFAESSFFRYRFGMGALFDELIQGLIDSDYKLSLLLKNRDNRLEMRQQLLPDCETISNLRGRLCAGGIHCTLAMQRQDRWNDDYVIPIQRRSAIIGEAQGLLSIVPQAFHQPMIDREMETCFAHTFYREIFEELFGGEEAARSSRRVRHDWFMQESPPIKWFRENQEHYRLVCTGFGLNLLSGNFEVALMCVIEDPGYWSEYGHLLKTNWEISASPIPLLSTKRPELIRSLLTKPDWTGSGLFSFTRALKHLGELDHDRVDLPEFRCGIEL